MFFVMRGVDTHLINVVLAPTEKGSTLKGIKLLLFGSLDTFSEGKNNSFDRVASP